MKERGIEKKNKLNTWAKGIFWAELIYLILFIGIRLIFNQSEEIIGVIFLAILLFPVFLLGIPLTIFGMILSFLIFKKEENKEWGLKVLVSSLAMICYFLIK